MPVRVTVIEGAPRHEADHFAVGIAQHLDQPQGICRQALLGAGCAVELHALGVGVRTHQHDRLGGIVVVVQQLLLGPANPGAIIEQGIYPLQD